ncbi:MAG: hypothetical protein JEY79_01180 [Pseudodesulfovibrio sp.]|nr:hypothetical protein [Pseudodesulfovibrio sp.]
MNLKAFVAESLKEIVLGIREAQEGVKETDAKIAPLIKHIPGEESASYWAIDGTHEGFQTVTFDVAVTVQESTGQKGEASIRIPYFSMGGDLEASQENGTVSRVKFELPIVWPTPPKK